MSKKNFIQVFEYQKLKYDENQDFKKHHFDAMVLFNEKNQNKYYTIVHKGVLFNSYVGVIQIGGLTIEILPKADNSNNPDKGTWQKVLLNMLKVCKHIQVDNVSETNLNKKYNSILEVYFEMYLNELESLIKKGLIKKYRRIQSNQNALKGKLVFSQNIQKNLIHKERFYCEHQLYDKDHLIHQILYRGLLILKDLVNNNLKDKLNRILFEFQDYQQIIINKNHFENEKPAIVFDEMVLVKSEPQRASNTVFTLHEGTKVFILETLDSWKKIQLTDGTEGWIEKTAIKEVKLSADFRLQIGDWRKYNEISKSSVRFVRTLCVLTKTSK